MSAPHYNALNQSSQAFEIQHKKSSKKKWIIIGSVLGLLVVAGGVAAGIIISKNNSKSSASSSSTGSSGGTKGNSTKGSETVDPNDPSKFALDPNLHKAFYGMAYTPEGALIEFGCTNTLENTIRDVQLMSQLTKRVRLYGADCNQTAQVLEAIKQTKVDLEVYPGIYTLPDHPEVYIRQRDLILDAIRTYGTEHIGGITVGNEFMLNFVTGLGILDANSPLAKPGSDIVVADILDTKRALAAMNLDKTIPVGNSDAGSFFATDIMRVMDYGLSNVHAWFANTTAAGAAPWVFEFFEEQNVKPAALLPNQPHMYIAETGWPTASSDEGNAHNGGSPASEAGLQTFLDTFVCQANERGVGYFFFEMFDEKWKDDKYGGVEGWWGLFTREKKLKNVKIPNCIAP